MKSLPWVIFREVIKPGRNSGLESLINDGNHKMWRQLPAGIFYRHLLRHCSIPAQLSYIVLTGISSYSNNQLAGTFYNKCLFTPLLRVALQIVIHGSVMTGSIIGCTAQIPSYKKCYICLQHQSKMQYTTYQKTI